MAAYIEDYISLKNVLRGRLNKLKNKDRKSTDKESFMNSF